MVIHTFNVNDQSNKLGRNPQDIEKKLDEMKSKLELHGHKFDRSWVTRSDLTSEEEEIHHLCHHSEKIALAFGLLITPPNEKIILAKNLRICGECHVSTKILSQIYSREFIINRSDHFTKDDHFTKQV